MTSPPPAGGSAGLKLVATAVLAVSVVGFLTGTREAPLPPPPAAPEPSTSRASPVPTYRGLREARRGDNQALYQSEFQRLRDEVATRPLVTMSLASAVEHRRERRAYDGAPPTVPHPVGQQRLPACLACHEHGALVDGRLARAMSHARSDSCLQCHVVAEDPRPRGATTTGPLTDNVFAGLFDGRGGTRAWRGAPPTVPHPPDMRGTCVSCHGPAGEAGLASSHPERASCLQCHALHHQQQQAFPRVDEPAPAERPFP